MCLSENSKVTFVIREHIFYQTNNDWHYFAHNFRNIIEYNLPTVVVPITLLFPIIGKGVGPGIFSKLLYLAKVRYHQINGVQNITTKLINKAKTTILHIVCFLNVGHSKCLIMFSVYLFIFYNILKDKFNSMKFYFRICDILNI